jgi:hypothetical protein
MKKILKKIMQNRGFLSSYLYGSTANFGGLNSLNTVNPGFSEYFPGDVQCPQNINNYPFFSSLRCPINVCTCYLALHLRPLFVSLQPKSKHLWSAVRSLFLYPKIGSAQCVLAWRACRGRVEGLCWKITSFFDVVLFFSNPFSATQRYVYR